MRQHPIALRSLYAHTISLMNSRDSASLTFNHDGTQQVSSSQIGHRHFLAVVSDHVSRSLRRARWISSTGSNVVQTRVHVPGAYTIRIIPIHASTYDCLRLEPGVMNFDEFLMAMSKVSASCRC